MVGKATQLPPHLLDMDQLRNLKVGESAYTVPWAMWVDDDMQCFLNGRYCADKQPGGTVEMRVERREDGYHVFAPKGKKWQPSSNIPWMGATEEDLIPVRQVH